MTDSIRGSIDNLPSNSHGPIVVKENDLSHIVSNLNEESLLRKLDENYGEMNQSN